MLQHFVPASKPLDAPVPEIDFDGVWRNELKSQMMLSVDADGHVTGTYQTGVGSPNPSEEFPLVGFATGDLISFTVNFGEHGSLTSWVGQHTIENGNACIRTHWLLAKNVVDEEEPQKLWGATLTGCNNFTR